MRFSALVTSLVPALRRRSLALLASVVCLVLANYAASAQTTTFTSGGNSSDPTINLGAAQSTPASSPIAVSGIASNYAVKTVQVTLTGVTTNGQTGFSMEGAGFWLQAPNGVKFMLLGATGDGVDGDDDSDSGSGLSNVNITIEDGAAAATPGDNPWAHTGSYTVGPSSYFLYNYGGAVPMIGVSYPQADGSATLDGSFEDTNPNGTWTLYVENFEGVLSPITVNSWSLNFTYVVTEDLSTSTVVSSSVNPVNSSDSAKFTATVSSATSPIGTVTFTLNGNTICSGVSLTPSGNSGTAQCTISGSTMGQGTSTIQALFAPGAGFEVSAGSMTELVEATATNPTTNEWCNAGSMSVPNAGVPQAYPSIITVPSTAYAAGTTVGNVTVELDNVSGSSGIFDQFLLVAPGGGTHNLDFLDSAWAESSASGVNLTMEDNGGQSPQGTEAPSTGDYDPYDNDSSNGFPTSGAPSIDSSVPQVPGAINHAPPIGSNTETFENSFNGAPVAGDWSLYVTSENAAPPITIGGGWCITFDVNTGVATTTTLTTSQQDQYTGQPVTLTATVTAGGSPVTSGGTVTFLDNGAAPAGTVSGNNVVTLNASGVATFTTSSLAQGDHQITATYSGDTNDNPGSGSLWQRIDNATATSVNGNVISACNTGAITSATGNKGAFTPNPSNIFVSNVPGTVSAVTLTLENYYTSSEGINETESLVEGPTGAALDFFSNTGSSTTVLSTPGNYSFSDSAADTVPDTSFAPGTYEPTSYMNVNDTADTFFSSASGLYTAPTSFGYAPTRGSDTLDGTFAGLNPNGTWSLYFDSLEAAAAEGANNGWCLNFTVTPVTVIATASHNGDGTGGDFVQNEQSAAITVNITNNGPGATGDAAGNNTNPLTVVDTLPTGLTYVFANGTGWACSASGQTVTCTDDNAVSQGSSYPELTFNVNVASSAPSSLSNAVSVSGAGVTSTSSAIDTITVQSGATLAVAVSHTGMFTQGQNGVWDITVSNTQVGSTTSGTVTVSDTLPSGYVLFNYSGLGWTCSGIATVTCTTSQGVSGGASFATLALTVSVPANSPTSVLNAASAYGGGDMTHTSPATAAQSNIDAVSVTQVAATVQPLTGSNQSTSVGGAFSAPLQALVVDAGGNLISGASVTFTVNPAGNGAGAVFSNSTAAITVTTNISGLAMAQITANDVAGAYTVTAMAGTGGASTSFSLANIPGPAASASVVSGSGQSAIIGQSFSNPLTVVVTDSYGNAESGATVIFAAPGSGASAVLSAPALTNALGETSVTATANGTVGSYSVIASVSGGITNASFALTNNPVPTYVVNTTTDDATGTASNCTSSPEQTCSLRDALAAASAAGAANITFASTAFPAPTGATITLSNGALNIPSNTTIQGLTTGSGATLANLVTVSGGGTTQVFTVNSGVTGAAIANLVVANGQNPAGAGIGNSGALTVANSTFSGNACGNFSGGAIFNTGTLTVTGSTFSGNSCTGSFGGGISNGSGGTLTVVDCTFFANSAAGGGGGINNVGSMTLTGSTFSSNSAVDGGGAIWDSGTMTVTNSVITQDGNGGECSGSGCPTNGTSGNIVDPTGTAATLAPLGNNGGPTHTLIPLPGSSAICAGVQSSLIGSTDQRGYPNTNTTYTGYSAGTPCVDAGAVQTDYSMSFTAPVPNVSPNVTMSPAPAVTLDESGAPFTAAAVTIPLTLASSPSGATLSGGSAATSAGVASYSSLSVNQPGTGDQLTATLALNPALTPGPAISAMSGAFNVSQISPTLSFTPNPSSQTYGAAIAAGTLDASASFNSAPVAGSFAYTTTVNGSPVTLTGTTVLPAGSYTITATFTPANGSEYTTASVTAGYVVNQATPAISWTTPAAITYGTALSGAQLDATASVPGTFTYTPVTGTVLGPGVQTLKVTFTPTDTTDYTGNTQTVQISVNDAVLTITAYNATRVYGAANPTFTGTIAGEQNGDTFAESFTTSATISSTVGAYSIVPSVAGTNLADYTQSVTDGTLTITQASSTTALQVSSTTITPGQSVTLTATVADGSAGSTGTPTGTVNFYDNGALLNSSPVALSGSVATLSTAALTAGATNNLTATYSGDVNFVGSSSTSSSSTSISSAALNFTITLAGPSNLTLEPGQSASFQVQVAPDYGLYAGTVNFTVSGLPTGATATFSPASIASNSGPQTVTVTITAPAATALLHRNQEPRSSRGKIMPLALAFLLLFGAGSLRRRGRALRGMLCVMVLLGAGAAATMLSGCGSSGGFFAQAPQSYAVTITATSGSLQQSTTITLNLQ